MTGIPDLVLYVPFFEFFIEEVKKASAQELQDALDFLETGTQADLGSPDWIIEKAKLGIKSIRQEIERRKLS